MDRESAYAVMRQKDHAVIGEAEAVTIAEAFGVSKHYVRDNIDVMYDSRFEFKGLTINRPDGHAKTFKEAGITSKRVMNAYKELWAEMGLRWEGVPLVYAIDMEALARLICDVVGVTYGYYFGRGSQVAECVEELRKHFGDEMGCRA
jgi:hypothetical protein